MKRKCLESFVHKVDRLSLWSGRILAAWIFLMICAMMFEVISRYLFERPTIWALQVSTMVFGTYMIGGGVYALFRKDHVTMDLLYVRWSPRTKAIVDACTFPLFMIFFSVALWKSFVYGIESVQMLEHSKTAWAPPIYHWKMTIPVVMVLMIFHGIADFTRNVIFAVYGKELE